MMLWLFAFAFGLAAAEPGADHSAAVLAGAPADADVALYYNVEATVKPAWDFVRNELPNQPLLKSVPKASQGLAELMVELERQLKELDASLGIHPFEDAHFAAGWVGIRAWDGEDPSNFSLLIAIHGTFANDLIQKAVATMAPQLSRTTIGGVDAWMMGGPGMPEFVVAQLGGVVIGGTRDWVEARIAAKKPSGEQAARMLEKISSGAVMVLDLVPSNATRKRLTADVDNLSASELLGGFDNLTMTVFADGMDLELKARSDAMYTRYHHLATGVLESMSAGRSGARAFAYLLMGMPSPKDPAFPAELSAVLSQPEELLALVDVLIGTGELTSNDRSQKKKKHVMLEARAAHVRQLMFPFALLAVAAVSL